MAGLLQFRQAADYAAMPVAIATVLQAANGAALEAVSGLADHLAAEPFPVQVAIGPTGLFALQPPLATEVAAEQLPVAVPVLKPAGVQSGAPGLIQMIPRFAEPRCMPGS